MSQPLSFSILLPVYYAHQKHTHGDFYYGRSLASALERLGHKTQLLAGEQWGETAPDDIALIIRGRNGPTRRMGRLMLEWCISCPPKLKEGDFENVDYFFAASASLARRIRRMKPADRVSVMYQAFDPELMFPDDSTPENDLIFVGTPRTEDRRPVVSYAAQSGLPTRIWGGGWEETEFAHLQSGGHIDNQDLGNIYRSGAVILNDHLVVMQRNALISNRLYDGLACGRAVLSDMKAGLPPELAPFVYGYQDAASFAEQAALALAETQERRQERRDFAVQMRELHSFDQRAKQICDQIDLLLAKQ
jgi:hypothetical protein